MPPWGYRDLPKRTGKPATPPAASTDETAASLTHWLNTSSSPNRRHNASCRWFGKTKHGRKCAADYPTRQADGRRSLHGAKLLRSETPTRFRDFAKLRLSHQLVRPSTFLAQPENRPLIAQILDSHTFDDARIPCQLVHTFSRNQTTAGATSETSPLDRLPAAG
jgi:hypothetical protein